MKSFFGQFFYAVCELRSPVYILLFWLRGLTYWSQSYGIYVSKKKRKRLIDMWETECSETNFFVTRLLNNEMYVSFFGLNWTPVGFQNECSIILLVSRVFLVICLISAKLLFAVYLRDAKKNLYFRHYIMQWLNANNFSVATQLSVMQCQNWRLELEPWQKSTAIATATGINCRLTLGFSNAILHNIFLVLLMNSNLLEGVDYLLAIQWLALKTKICLHLMMF